MAGLVAFLAENLDVVMFLIAIAALLSGYPVAFTLAGVALAFAGLGVALGAFDPVLLTLAPSRIFGVMTNQVLVAVPLFVFMGVMLEKSKIAEELLETMGGLFGPLRGGLGVAVVAVGALLAASTGIVGATVVTMGLLSLPTMLAKGYAKPLATGAIAASGTLGQIIPPSIVLVLLGDVMGSAYQKAQLDQGIFAPETVSVGDLFAGALIPGLMLVGLYASYMMAVALLRPAAAPALTISEAVGATALARVTRIVRALAPPLLLIFAVLGSILAGLATPTEAAALGATGAVFLAGLRDLGDGEDDPSIPWARSARRAAAAGLAAAGLLVVLTAFVDLRLGRESPTGVEQGGAIAAALLIGVAVAGLAAALYRAWMTRCLQAVTRDTARITAMVFVILIGATLFALVFRGLGGDERVAAVLETAAGGVLAALDGLLSSLGFASADAPLADSRAAQAAAGVFIVMIVMFVLGFFLDFIEITFVVVPLVAPPLLALGADPVWLGVMMALNLQTSFLTPPFGFALFYLRGVAPPSVATTDIYRGAAPFVLIQLLALLAVAAFPVLATGLPGLVFG